MATLAGMGPYWTCTRTTTEVLPLNNDFPPVAALTVECLLPEGEAAPLGGGDQKGGGRPRLLQDRPVSRKCGTTKEDRRY